MFRLAFRAMGSRVLILADGERDASTLAQVELWFEDWEQTLSRFRVDSELTRINSSTGTPHAVSDTLWAVFQTALAAERWTEGLVNPLVLNALMHAGYVRSFDEMPSDVAADPAGCLDDGWPTIEAVRQEVPALSSLIAEGRSRTLFIPHAAGVDFGGVAKGWAAQQAMLRLKPAGPTLVSAGGDIAVSGPMANGEPWPIDVEDPFQGGSFLETIFLERGGVATSGKDHRNWRRAGALQHHVVDPRTGNPALTDVLTATVVASTVMRAEAEAKAALILGSEAGMARLDEIDGVEGLLVLVSGQLLYSRNFEKYV